MPEMKKHNENVCVISHDCNVFSSSFMERCLKKNKYDIYTGWIIDVPLYVIEMQMFSYEVIEQYAKEKMINVLILIAPNSTKETSVIA